MAVDIDHHRLCIANSGAIYARDVGVLLLLAVARTRRADADGVGVTGEACITDLDVAAEVKSGFAGSEPNVDIVVPGVATAVGSCAQESVVAPPHVVLTGVRSKEGVV